MSDSRDKSDRTKRASATAARRLRVLSGRAIRDLSDPAIVLSPDYEIVAVNQAYRARYGDFALGAGHRCYEVSHGYDEPCDRNGEDCPMRTCRDTGQRSRVFHIHASRSGPEYVDVDMRPLVHAGEPLGFIERIRPLRAASAQSDGAFVGRSRAFVDTVALLQRVAPSAVPVLLLGESGTGKELAARSVHESSPRRAGPFVAVECSGLSESLFESELFGHRRGAFTGAHTDKQGLVEAAAGGTLFLDELGDVPLHQQVKLLRLLESSTYRRVGDTEVRRADFRLLCATHRDLPSMIEAGTFRQDLYYRISAFPITMPPLRARREDLPLLCEMVLANVAPAARMSPEALSLLARYTFPGNIRELRNLIERAVLLSDDDLLRPLHFPALQDPTTTPAKTAHVGVGGPWPWGDGIIPLAEVERRYLGWASARMPSDRDALARRLQISPRTLYRKLARATRA